ncbi:hypothetical protein G9P44_001564 [Scheffersomyces stipitis]|nr:hypothetical protein G9P44_001564 [Scheffersomyces stipitis]
MTDSNNINTKKKKIGLPPLRKRRLQPISKRGFADMAKLSDFTVIEKLGQGTFGVVQKAKSKRTGQTVAIKQLINHSAKEGFPITAMREITILRQLNHINILTIVEMIHEEPKVKNPADLVTSRGCFYTVSPYMSSDLVGLLENPNVSLELSHIKCLMRQLLKGIQYIHESKFLHRDVKAANILINSRGVLKIADFGLARVYHGKVPKLGTGPGGGERAYTGLVVTRWYRPPELLLGERKYTTAVDLWGIGCVFAELFTHKPILVGKSDAHQAQLVFGLVGSPINWTHASSLPNKTDLNIGLSCVRSLEQRFHSLMPPDGVTLLSGLLALDPYKRYNALDALNHEFFKNDPLPLRPEDLPHFEESHEIDKEKFKKLKERSQNSSSSSFTNGGNYGSTQSHPIYNDHRHDRETETYIPKSQSQNGKPELQGKRGESLYSSSFSASKDSKSNSNRRGSLSSRNNLNIDSTGNKTHAVANLPRKPPPTSSTSSDGHNGDHTTANSRKKNNSESPPQSKTRLQPSNILRSSKPVTHSSSGIFMDSSRRKRPLSIAAKLPMKKQKSIVRQDDNDSDLTDMESEIANKEEESLKTFLDGGEANKKTNNEK